MEKKKERKRKRQLEWGTELANNLISSYLEYESGLVRNHISTV